MSFKNKIILAFAALTIFSSSFASALSLSANSNYDLTGQWSLVFSGTNTSYYVKLNLNNDLLRTGNRVGNQFTTLDLTSALASASVSKLVNNNWVLLNDGSSVLGNIDMDMANVRVSGDGNVAAAIGGESTFPQINVNLNGTIEGHAFNANTTFMGAYMNFAQGGFNGLYDQPINLFSNNGNLNFAMAYFGDTFHTWLKAGSININGQNFGLGGDIHANVAAGAVPEPASLVLLGSALIGGIAKRRKALAS